MTAVFMAALGITVAVLLLQYAVTCSERTWRMVVAALSALFAIVTVPAGASWRSWVLVPLSTWGLTEFLLVLYGVLLAGGDLLRLTVQRNTQRRR